MNNILKFDFQGQHVSFDTDGWINATEAATRFNKRAAEWLRLPATQSYMEALAKALGLNLIVGKSHHGLVRVVRGGFHPCTWLHPKLAVPFARWLSDEFAVQCDLYIDSILFGNGYALDQFRNACNAFEAAKLAASQYGKGLAIFRWQKPELIETIGYWQEQLKLPLVMAA
ncbi:KilA-N domain-containing protein [Saezia sanguinis]|uniref:KilA-N domain-containing protein n=1 Tax=Saezia sanguinis TaxID=1965230 RepID=UPI003053DBA6